MYRGYPSLNAKLQFAGASASSELKEGNILFEAGYALDNEENELGIRCIAVPVFDYHDTPQYALSVSTLVGRMPDERLGSLSEQLLNTARDISRVLGHKE